jgi:O-antigen biosynthesis protein WbqP
MKRAFDMIVASAVLLLGMPILLLVGVAVKIQSTGPAIFSQTRVGRHGTLFRCHKFRSMMHGTQEVPTHLASRSEITNVGVFLRRTKVDEFPQFWNVLKGEMTLVGPRPCLPSQTDLIEARRRRGVLSLRPGITGLAQVRGVDMSTPDKLAEVDAEYLSSQTFALDMRILFRTVTAVFDTGRSSGG